MHAMLYTSITSILFFSVKAVEYNYFLYKENPEVFVTYLLHEK